MQKRPHAKRDQLQGSIDELATRQQNVLLPEVVKNARLVDRYLIFGSADATLLQRIGAWLFGLAFIAVGVTIVSLGSTGPNPIGEILFGAVPIILGMLVFLNGCRRRKRRSG